mmetsp:Transcript_35225/g.101286  ORF Transcript_35225/g.101286 Transcript_35225/m.101286 type:complete len:362 (-) Transcript_35225:2-1087(-)
MLGLSLCCLHNRATSFQDRSRGPHRLGELIQVALQRSHRRTQLRDEAPPRRLHFQRRGPRLGTLGCRRRLRQGLGEPPEGRLEALHLRAHGRDGAVGASSRKLRAPAARGGAVRGQAAVELRGELRGELLQSSLHGLLSLPGAAAPQPACEPRGDELRAQLREVHLQRVIHLLPTGPQRSMKWLQCRRTRRLQTPRQLTSKLGPRRGSEHCSRQGAVAPSGDLLFQCCPQPLGLHSRPPTCLALALSLRPKRICDPPLRAGERRRQIGGLSDQLREHVLLKGATGFLLAAVAGCQLLPHVVREVVANLQHPLHHEVSQVLHHDVSDGRRIWHWEGPPHIDHQRLCRRHRSGNKVWIVRAPI